MYKVTCPNCKVEFSSKYPVENLCDACYAAEMYDEEHDNVGNVGQEATATYNVEDGWQPVFHTCTCKECGQEFESQDANDGQCPTCNYVKHCDDWQYSSQEAYYADLANAKAANERATEVVLLVAVDLAKKIAKTSDPVKLSAMGRVNKVFEGVFYDLRAIGHYAQVGRERKLTSSR